MKIALMLIAGGVLSGQVLSANSFNFLSLTDPSATSNTYAEGINDGTVVGYYLAGAAKGFTYSVAGASYTTLNVALAGQTIQQSELIGINDTGTEIAGAGYYTSGGSYFHAVTENTGTGIFTQIPITTGFSGALASFADGVNSSGTVVGSYSTVSNTGPFNAFIYAPGATSPFSASLSCPGVSGATGTLMWAVNDSNDAAGYCSTATGNVGFTYQFSVSGTSVASGTWTEYTVSGLTPPDSSTIAGTDVHAIDSNGNLGGFYTTLAGDTYGFYYNATTTTYQTIDVAGILANALTGYTEVLGMDNSGDLVGVYKNTANSNDVEGFIASPITTPEPGTMALSSLLFVGLAAFYWKRRSVRG
jgi:hypothetical protein